MICPRMTQSVAYLICVMVALLSLITGTLLAAQVWKPKPLGSVRAWLIVVAAVVLAGTACSIAGRDISILYWWLLGLPMVIISFLLLIAFIVFTNRSARWLYQTSIRIVTRPRGKD
jgi:hypothetical protein